MKIYGLHFVHQLELLQELNSQKSLKLSPLEMLDVIFKPWTGTEIAISHFVYPEGEFGKLLTDAFLPEDLNCAYPEDLPHDLWTSQVVEPFLARYEIQDKTVA